MRLWGMFSGKYNVWISVLITMANALGTSMIPSLTAAVATGNSRMIHKKIHLVIRSAMLIAIPGFVGLTVMGGPILSMLYGGNIKIPTTMMHIGAVSIVFFCLSTVTNAVLQGINRASVPVRHAAISLVIHLVSLFLMMVMLKWGIYSIVVGNVIFSLSMCILNQHEIRMAVGYQQETRKTFLLPLAASIIMGAVSFVFYQLFRLAVGRTIATCVTLLLAVVIYAVGLVKLGAVTERELRSLPKGALLIRICKRVRLL